MTMTSSEKRMLEREALRSVIQQWNANRLDLFELSEPDENLQFHGVMRFYFQDHGQKVATKCIRVASDATVSDVIDNLIEKFRPDMRMLSMPNYALYEVHSNGEERKLNPDEKPLLVQLNWHIDDREGRFLLRDTVIHKTNTLENSDINFKRKLSKREKKEQKKKEKLAKLNSNASGDAENHVAEKLYNELPDTSFTRSISNPEAVMRRRRQQILEKKLQQFRSRDGGPDTGGTLKIYGESLCRDVPYKTLLLSIRDCAQAVVREMLAKYGLDKTDPLHYCLVQVNSDGTEYILDDDECPLSILMNHPTSRGSIMFHVRRRPADSQPRRRKKKPLGVSNGSNNVSVEREGPMLVEITHTGDGGRRIKLSGEPVEQRDYVRVPSKHGFNLEVGSANTNPLQLFGPSIQPRHCLISLHEGVCTVTPLHADALTFVNGHHIQQPTILHNGSVVMFGRGSSYRFVDSPSDGRYNLALSQSQLDSACLYESRSPASPSWHDDDRITSPAIAAHNNMTGGVQSQQKSNYLDASDTRSLSTDTTNETSTTVAHTSGSIGGIGKLPQYAGNNSNQSYSHQGNNNDNTSLIMQQQQQHQIDERKSNVVSMDEQDGQIETETKSVSSIKSGGSIPEIRKIPAPETVGGQEPILPAVLEFPETHQDIFLNQVITELDFNMPNFKLAPVYTLYLCARYRASTHYRPDLKPTERAHKLTVFLHHVANLIYQIVQEQYQDPRILSFWMANSSEFLHFLKSDRHISAFSVQAQEVLAESVQTAFRNLVNCFRIELNQTLNQFLSENIDHDSAAGLVLTVLGSAMALFRRCRVNAALTIQLFSQLFHYINCICFNTIVKNHQMCVEAWGKVITHRLHILEEWARRQGLEVAAECHLAKIKQCAGFLQTPKTNIADCQQLACTYFRLNSLQMAVLLSQEKIPKNLVDAAVRMAESVADELTRADGREVTLEESQDLPLALLIPDDGFSCDVVRGIPAGLVDFLSHLQAAGMCRLAAQPTSIGLWTVYMHNYNTRSSSSMSTKMPQPEIQVIKLHKNSNGMGLSIVAAKGAGQERLGIYIKSVVPGGAADADGRLQAGDQLLKVDGQSLIGITQERAADYLVRTGPVVTLEVAKQGAIFHGLATLLQQPSPVIQRGNRRMSEKDIPRMVSGTGVVTDNKPPLPVHGQQQLPNSKSVPALHHVGNNMGIAGNKARSIHNLTGNTDQSFYQNLSVYRAQNQSQPNLGDRSQGPSSASGHPTMNSTSATTTSLNPQPLLNRPASAYFSNNNNNTMPLQQQTNTMPYNLMPQTNPNSGTLRQQQLPPQQKTTNFMRENQTQQSLRMNQMMAPSMPNIAAHAGATTSGGGYSQNSPSSTASNISSSQSMQNVNMINGPQQMGYHYTPSTTVTGTYHGGDFQQQQQHLHNQHMLRGGGIPPPVNNKVMDMNEMLKRRHQRQQEMMPMHSIIDNGNGNIMQQQTQQQQQLSPVTKQLPPTAPKPQPNRQHLLKEDLSPPLPPTATHPLYKSSNNISASSQNLSGYYQPNAQQQQQSSSSTATSNNKSYTNAGSNPWEREEREKEHEIRREHVRHWRDIQISDLSSIHLRTPQQDEQLKTLLLERDFERRALETDEMEEENDVSAYNTTTQETIRLTQQPVQITPPTTNIKQVDVKTNTLTNNSNDTADSYNYGGSTQQPSNSSNVQPKSILKHHNNARSTDDTNSSGISVTGNGMTSNPSSPSKQAKSASFADDRYTNDNGVSQVARDLSNLSFNNYNEHSANNIDHSFDQHQTVTQMISSGGGPVGGSSSSTATTTTTLTSAAPPPPPPERNSSYIIMSQKQQQTLRNNIVGGNNGGSILTTTPPTNSSTVTNDHLSMASNANYMSNVRRTTNIPNSNNNNNMALTSTNVNNNIAPSGSVSQLSLSAIMANRDNKRVSFHDEENNSVIGSDSIISNDIELIREDSDRYSGDSTSMMMMQTTPELSDTWNSSTTSTTHQQTPGVIGAQEVYRDPRTRRLQEKQQLQQQQKSGEVPEKLSFKEKMKMFALESGENQTPKDKLKISRAQRDIDAVH